jgi:predicted Zn finger-like uncharacterized protein
MKIVCDACQAKYSISDDKVQGKVFKIRCKKCSNIIVVRGGAGAAEPAPAPQQEAKDTRVYDYGYEGGGAPAADDQIWHVVINQDQVGPMTAGEIQQRFAGGEIDAESYIWREGFADWLPLAQVDVFASLAASAPAPSHGGAAAVNAMFGAGAGMNDESGTMRSDPGDLFASAAASGHHAHEDDGGDLFGGKPQNTAQQAAANAKLRGERNENSVLFSLNNLAQLASDRPAAAAPAATGSAPVGATGPAGGEGSGLIDIRSMASAYMGSTGAAKPATASAIGSIDDLPVFGGGGFSEPAVIVPTARAANNNKLLYALIGTVGVLAVVAVIMVVVLVSGGKSKDKDDNKPNGAAEVAMADKTDKTTTDNAADKTADKTPDKAADGSATTTDTAAKTPEKTTDTAAKTPEKTPTPTADKTVAKTPTPTPPPVTHHTPTPTPAVHRDTPKTEPIAKKDPLKTDDKGGTCDEVSCVLNNYEGACCQKFRKGGGTKTPTPPSGSDPTPRKAASDLPDGLDRAMISDGVGRVKGRVMACGSSSSAKGQVKVSVKVSPNGSVASVSVKNTPDAALGNCVQAQMSRATFAKTQNGGSFGYPFMFP